ncbi:MAG: tRNA lysidine(34) synthetase TilS [Rhodospirillaceae bacterium]
MDPLGPFESAPHLAVGVSGGADSLALVLLAARWARARGGMVTALTVDHGLRPEAAAEAVQVGRWMAAEGIPHAVLRGEGPPPMRNIQAEARALRHGLLRGWCRSAGVLHLLLAHNLEDQAETFLLRLARGSGVGGLSGMAALSWTPEVRVLRPLLSVHRSALEAMLTERGQPWVRDPSNDDVGYGRVRMRRLMPVLDGEGAGADRLAATARRLGTSRQAVEAAVTRLLAEAVALHPAACAWVDPVAFRAAPAEVGLRGLRLVLACVGGRPFGPRSERAEAALERLGCDAVTVGGCRLLPQPGAHVLVAREARSLPEVNLQPGGEALWDGRFRVRLGADELPGQVCALGAAGWALIKDRTADRGLPAAVRLTMPALWRAGQVIAVPGLDLERKADFQAVWAPRQVLLSSAFRLAPAPSSII